MEKNQITLGKWLQLLRNNKGYTQRELADELMISYRTIQQWECDHSIPSLYTAYDLATLYKMPMEELINGYTQY